MLKKRILPLICLLAVSVALVTGIIFEQKKLDDIKNNPDTGSPFDDTSKQVKLIPSRAKLTSDEILSRNVRIEIQELSPRGIRYTIENISEQYTYEHDFYYYLDQYIEGVEGVSDGWYSLPGISYGVSNVMPLVGILPARPGKKIELSSGWYSRYGYLPAGKYRLIQSLKVDYLTERDEDYLYMYTIAIEFEIE